MRLVKIKQRLLKSRQTKEIAFLSSPLKGSLVNRAGWLGGLFVHIFELVTIAAVPAFVTRFVDVAAFIEQLPEFLNRGLVSRIGCSNPLVVFDSKRRESNLELVNNLIHVLLDRHATGRCRALDVDAVLVGAC